MRRSLLVLPVAALLLGGGAAVAGHGSGATPIIPKGTVPDPAGAGVPSGLFLNTETRSGDGCGRTECVSSRHEMRDRRYGGIDTTGGWSPSIILVPDPVYDTKLGPVTYDGFRTHGTPQAGGVYNGAQVDGVGEFGVVASGKTTPPAGCVGAYAEDYTADRVLAKPVDTAVHGGADSGDRETDVWICTYGR